MTAAMTMTAPRMRAAQPRRNAAAKRKTRASASSHPLLVPGLVVAVALALVIPRIHTWWQAQLAPVTVADDMQEISTDVYLFAVGCGYPKPSPEAVASSFQTSKVSPWGYQYSLVAGGNNTLWICIGTVPERNREGLQEMFREQKRPTVEGEDGLFYVMCKM